MKDEGKRNSLISRLKQSYRLILLKDVTFREVGSFKITPIAAILYVLTSIFIIIFLAGMLVIYTPLKELVPGYGELESNRPYMELRERVNVLETELTNYQIYVNSFKNMLSDSIVYLEEEDDGPVTVHETPKLIERIAEDDSLRAKVDITRDLLRIATARSSKGQVEPGASGSQYYFAPVNGIISHRFNRGTSHFGIDLIAPEGSPIKSIADGVVILAGNIMKTGHTIAVQHDNDLVTYYMHNSSLLKNKGDVVKAGEVIAIIGNTGELTSGPHLHFEMWYKGEALDPEKYLSGMR